MTNGNTAPAILITIPLSHYCEKARWALDRTALPYREEPHAPLLHRLATKRNERGTVPVLVHGSSRFSDSTDILKHADAVCGGDLLYPRDAELRREVDALEERFDTELARIRAAWRTGRRCHRRSQSALCGRAACRRSRRACFR
jgi:glutathione S-transferase